MNIVFIDDKEFNKNKNFYETGIEKAFGSGNIGVEQQLLNGVYFVLAIKDEFPCGVIRFCEVVDNELGIKKEDKIIILRQVLVDEKFRNQGIANLMLGKGIEVLTEKGYKKIISFVEDSNQGSQKLHNRNDFSKKCKGVYENSYYDGYGDMDQMWVREL